MSGTTLKPWNKLVRLRDDVRSGELSLQEFAADLFDVVNRTGKRPVYEQPARFFPLTFATTSLRDIVAGTADRLRGKSAKAIRQLEMTYGGGKTHTLVTLTHIFRDPDALPDVPSVHEFESAMGGKAPKARVAAVCFDKLDLESGIRAIAPDGSARMLKQPWSVIAFQLAGDDGLRMIHPDGAGAERDTPPRDGGPLESVLEAPAKEGLGTLILFDEVLMYASEKAKQKENGELFCTQFLNFLQSLTQAVSKVDTASLLVSLLASDPNRDDEFGRQLLADMSNVLGRKEDESFLPVGKDDVAEVLRRRLLDPETTKDPEAFRPSVVAVVKALSALDPEFAKSPALRDQQEKRYLASFPFDPSLMDVFYTKWTSGLPLFQRTSRCAPHLRDCLARCRRVGHRPCCWRLNPAGEAWRDAVMRGAARSCGRRKGGSVQWCGAGLDRNLARRAWLCPNGSGSAPVAGRARDRASSGGSLPAFPTDRRQPLRSYH